MAYIIGTQNNGPNARQQYLVQPKAALLHIRLRMLGDFVIYMGTYLTLLKFKF